MINGFFIGGPEMKNCIYSRSHWQYSIPMHQRDAQRQRKFPLYRSSVHESAPTSYQPNTSVTAATWDYWLCSCKWAVRFMVGWTTRGEFQTFGRSRRQSIGKSSPRICACWFNVPCCQSDPAAQTHTYTHTHRQTKAESSPHGFWCPSGRQ